MAVVFELMWNPIAMCAMKSVYVKGCWLFFLEHKSNFLRYDILFIY